MLKYLLFDLDGTIADTGPGIIKSARLALEDFGFPDEPDERLRRFVGPPLDSSFREFYGLTREQSFAAVEKYRESYRVEGVLESPLYPGMEDALKSLSKHGTLCLATSKPMVFAEKILDLRGVRDYFTVAVGANLDGSMTDKAQVIAAVISKLGDPPKDEVMMIGDRRHDILGAKANGILSMGVEYGYAEPGELSIADYVVPSVEAMEELCLSLME